MKRYHHLVIKVVLVVLLCSCPWTSWASNRALIQQFSPMEISSNFTTRRPTSSEKEQFLSSSLTTAFREFSGAESAQAALNELNLPIDIDNSLIMTRAGMDLWLVPAVSNLGAEVLLARVQDNRLRGISISLRPSQTSTPLFTLSNLEKTTSYVIDFSEGSVYLEGEVTPQSLEQGVIQPQDLNDVLGCVWNEIVTHVLTDAFGDIACNFGQMSAICVASGFTQCIGAIAGTVASWSCSELVSWGTELLLCLGSWPSTNPTATTNLATSITSTSAMLNGIVNPNGSSTNAFFEWGRTTSYGNVVPVPPIRNVGSGTSNVTVTETLGGLLPDTPYNFRIVASNSYGTTYGSNMSFRTLQSTQKVATPIFSPGAGTYTGSVTVSISSSTSGVTIRFSTNGTDPTSSSPIYASPLSFTTTTTLKARGFKSGMTDSDVATAVYTIQPVAWQSEAVNWLVSYGNSWNKAGTITKPGATQVRVHFSSINVEACCDSLTTNAGDTWRGTYSNVTSTAKPGNSIGLTLVSDGSVTGSFTIDRVEWQGTVTGPATKSGDLFGGSTSNFTNGTLMKSATNPDTYIYYNGNKHRIPNETTFEALGWVWNNVQTISPDVLNNIPTSSPVPDTPWGGLLRAQGDTKVYFAWRGLYHIPDPQTALDLKGANWGGYVNLDPYGGANTWTSTLVNVVLLSGDRSYPGSDTWGSRRTFCSTNSASCGDKNGCGYCTYHLATKRKIVWSGDAKDWYVNAPSNIFFKGNYRPVPGAIMVLGTTGTNAWGHVAFVESVGQTTFTVSEMNWGANMDSVGKTDRYGCAGPRTLTIGNVPNLIGFIY